MVKQVRSMRNIARDLRQRQTPSETILWAALRDRQILGYKFRRQHSIGCFVVDFFCAEAQVAVEIDGVIHNYQREADAERQTLIEEMGVRFVRITTGQVENDLAGALKIIGDALVNQK